MHMPNLHSDFREGTTTKRRERSFQVRELPLKKRILRKAGWECKDLGPQVEDA